MRLIPVYFMALLVLTMTTSSGLQMHPQEPVNEAFAETGSSLNDLGNYVILGIEEVELKKDVVVINGNVGVNNVDSEVKLDKGTVFNDPNSALVGDSVKIEKDAMVQNVFYNELENKGEILGTENTPLDLPVIDNFPNIPDFPPGTTSINVDKDETLTLAPEQYDEIFVDEDGTLMFEGGSYSASKIETKKGANLLFVDSSEVVIQDELKLDKESTLGPSQTSSISASDIVLFVVNDDVDIDKDSVIDANIFAPNGEIKMDKGAQATGAFVANKVKIDKDSTLTLDSQLEIISLVDEYLNLLSKINDIGTNIVETDVTPQLIDSIKSDLARFEEVIIKLQLLGFDGTGTVELIDDHGVGTVSFFNKETSDPLFETLIPDGALAIFAAFGMIEEFQGTSGAFILDEQITLISESLPLFQALTNSGDDEISSNIVLAGIGAYHPSTGETFAIIPILIYLVILQCFASGLCPLIINTVISLILENLLKSKLPRITVSGLKFNDVNNNGNVDTDENGVGDFEFELQTSRPFLVALGSSNPTISEPDGSFDFTIFIANMETEFQITESPMDGWIPNINGNVQSINVNSLTFDQNIGLFVFGNLKTTAELIVIKNVINDDGGTLNPSDFTIHVTGNNPTPSDFAGSGSTGAILFQDDYSSNAGWTQVSTGVTVNDPSFPGIVKLNMVPDASDRRVHKSLGATLSDTQWVLESEFLVNAHSGNPGHQVYVLSSGSNNPGEAASDVDMIGISYNSISGDPVGFEVRSKDGATTLQRHGTKIPFDAGEQVYLRLSRTAATDVTLEVFSDAARTQHIAGSPVMVTDIPATIVGLNTLQHANTSQGGSGRNLTAEIDNTVISGIGTGTGGTIVTLGPGTYSVTEDPEAGYTPSFSPECMGNISGGDTITCIIENHDDASTPGTCPAGHNDNGDGTCTAIFTTSLDLWVQDVTDDDACNDGDVRDATDTVLRVQGNDEFRECHRSYVEWDISSIPDGSEILDTAFTYDSNGQTQEIDQDCQLRHISQRDAVSTVQEIFDDMGDGTIYATTTCSIAGDNKNVDLGTTADSDLESQLSSDWFAIGIRVPTEIFVSRDTVLKLQSEEAGASAVPPPTLTVTYTPSTAPTNVILELTRSHSGHILDNTDDNDCADGNLMAFTTSGVPFEPVFIKIRSGGVNDCNVGMREWDVSLIPDNADIISVEWIGTFHQNIPNQFPPVCDIVQLDTRPSTAGGIQSLLDEIIGNPGFLNDDSFCSSVGSKTINLGQAAADHLENTSLANDWFAFAIKARPDTTQQGFHQSIYTNEQTNPTKLRIVYSVP